MSEHDPHDPWASLAESLGASPTSEPSPPRPAPAPKPAPRPRSESKPRPAPAAGGDWDALASDLGVGGSPATEPPRPAPRPTPPPPRHEREAGEQSPRAERPREEAESPDEAAFNAPRAEDGERREADDGERRGRRRRGRRGGRGRGRRDGERSPTGEDRGEVAREPRDRDFEDRPRDFGDRTRGNAEDDLRAARPSAGDFASRPAPRSEREPMEADLFAPAGDEAPGAEAAGRDRPTDDDGDRPRRRRRRGRRGGRGRARDERDAVGRETGERRESPAGSTADQVDDEPLPTGYGVRPAPRTDAPRGEGEAARKGEEDGEGRGRRRRRRGRGENRSGREAGGATGSNRSTQGRRGRRSEGELRSSSSSLSRGRRADFAPVAGGYDEDDEGLEFLGIEEASREAPRRESRPGDDEILAESGLDNVRDVPSWVEAIGIVIAGNLDARSRPRGEGGRR